MYAPGLGFLMFAVGINLRPEAFKKVFMSPKVMHRPLNGATMSGKQALSSFVNQCHTARLLSCHFDMPWRLFADHPHRQCLPVDHQAAAWPDPGFDSGACPGAAACSGDGCHPGEHSTTSMSSLDLIPNWTPVQAF